MLECQRMEGDRRRADMEREAVEKDRDRIEIERQQLASLVELQRPQMTRLRMELYAEKMANLITRVRRDGLTEIAIYGAGEVGEALISVCRERGVHVRCAIDQNELLWGSKMQEVPVISFVEAMKGGNDVYSVASFSFA